ncbi:MAG: hypothetical protein OXC46_06635 [Thaumarchaeota archaeon]|nr:hypothetical protein [Nitrososphaerota archaeon]
MRTTRLTLAKKIGKQNKIVKMCKKLSFYERLNMLTSKSSLYNK